MKHVTNYRLAQNLHSDGYTGNTDYRMTYSPTTRIGSKYSDHPSIGHPNLIYGYDISGKTHQSRVIYDFHSIGHIQLYWDSNGNLRQIQPANGYARFHLWDDDNKLMLSVGPTTCGYYGNASDGKRAYKISGKFNMSTMNGNHISGMAYFDNTILYPNPYVTITRMGYTKHYYMGSERIATAIGGGGFCDMTTPTDIMTADEKQMMEDWSFHLHHYPQTDCYISHNQDITGHTNYNIEYVDDREELYDFSVNVPSNSLLCYSMENIYCHKEYDDEVFFYHPDHLGGATWMTDIHRVPVQYLHYGPYGEMMENQRATSFDERFKFTGKERDEETGYDYFGARNYLPAISIWGAVDPLADKYIYNSPYVYCNGNPITFVDLHGDSTRLWVETTGVGHTWITTGEGNEMTVYSYGRYDDLGKDKNSARSLTLEGDGVLLRLTGTDAQKYQDDKLANTTPFSIVIQDLNDAEVQNYFDNLFYGSIELPSKETGKYYQSSNAHVIDTYHLLNNNCTTKSVHAINALGSALFQKTYVPSANGKGYNMNLNLMFVSPLNLYMYIRKK